SARNASHIDASAGNSARLRSLAETRREASACVISSSICIGLLWLIAALESHLRQVGLGPCRDVSLALPLLANDELGVALQRAVGNVVFLAVHHHRRIECFLDLAAVAERFQFRAALA